MPDIGQPSASDKNSDDEIRNAVASDATRFSGGFIDQQITQAGAAIQIFGQFQLSSADFIQAFKDLARDNSMTSVAFKPDGTEMFLLGNDVDDINQYSLSTAFDVSTASFSQAFDVSPQDTNVQGLEFRPDGSQVYVAGQGGDRVYQYSLSTDYDISTATFDQSFSVNTQETDVTELAVSSDGTRLYVTGFGSAKVHQYSLSTAFDVSTASVSKSFDVSPQDTGPQGMELLADGSQLYIAGNGTQNIYQYNLSTDFDISTASFAQSINTDSRNGTPTDVTFKPDGSQMYVMGRAQSRVYQYGVGKVVGELS